MNTASASTVISSTRTESGGRITRLEPAPAPLADRSRLAVLLRKTVVSAVGLLLGASAAAADTPPDEGWPGEDGEARALLVNEGQLQFIAPVLDRPVLHADTHLSIDAQSLHSGWVDMRQCYRHLDAVNRTDLTYAYREISDLRVTSAERIAEIRIESQSLELEGVQRDAQLCVQARVRILERITAGSYRMRNGPYHRKFLDGYYPYHVTLTVGYPHEHLRLERLEPGAQDGFEVSAEAGSLSIDAWFEGVLRIEFVFAEQSGGG